MNVLEIKPLVGNRIVSDWYNIIDNKACYQRVANNIVIWRYNNVICKQPEEVYIEKVQNHLKRLEY